jgi:hypothetical protein
MNADIASGLPDNDSCSLFAALGFTEELFEAQGTIQASYDLHDVPDELNVCYEGTDIFSTRGHGIRRRHAVGAAQIRHLDSTAPAVEINAPTFGTHQVVSVACPKM